MSIAIAIFLAVIVCLPIGVAGMTLAIATLVIAKAIIKDIERNR